MAELEIDQSHLPRVQEVCQCFAVLEDSVLAHNLQEQEIEQYYTTNIQKNQLVQNDIRIAKRLQDEEEEERAQQSRVLRQASRQLEEQDSEYARTIQEEIQRSAEEAHRREQEDEEIAKRIQEEEERRVRRRSREQESLSDDSASVPASPPPYQHTLSHPQREGQHHPSSATRWQCSTSHTPSDTTGPLPNAPRRLAAQNNTTPRSNEGHTDSNWQIRTDFREPGHFSGDSEESDSVFPEQIPRRSQRRDKRLNTAPCRRRASLHDHPRDGYSRSLHSHSSFREERRNWEEERELDEDYEYDDSKERREWNRVWERNPRGEEYEGWPRRIDDDRDSRSGEIRERRCSRSDSVRLEDRNRHSDQHRPREDRHLVRTWTYRENPDKRVRFQDDARRCNSYHGDNSSRVWEMLGQVLRERGVAVRHSFRGGPLQLRLNSRDSQVPHGSEVSYSRDSQVPHGSEVSYSRDSQVPHGSEVSYSRDSQVPHGSEVSYSRDSQVPHWSEVSYSRDSQVPHGSEVSYSRDSQVPHGSEVSYSRDSQVPHGSEVSYSRDSQVPHGSEVSYVDSQPHQRAFQRAAPTRRSYHGDVREWRRLSHQENSERDYREGHHDSLAVAEDDGVEEYEEPRRDSDLANRERGDGWRNGDIRHRSRSTREEEEGCYHRDRRVRRSASECWHGHKEVEEELSSEEEQEVERREERPHRRVPQRSQSLSSSVASSRARSRHTTAGTGPRLQSLPERACLDLGELQQVLQDEELARRLQEEEERPLTRSPQSSPSPPHTVYPEGDFRVAQVAQDEEIARFMQKQEMKSKRRSRELEGPASWREHREMISQHDRRAARERQVQRERLDSEGLPSPSDYSPENQPPSPISTIQQAQQIRNIAEELDPTFKARRQGLESLRVGQTVTGPACQSPSVPHSGSHDFLEEPTFVPPTKRQSDKSGLSKPKEKKENCKQQ